MPRTSRKRDLLDAGLGIVLRQGSAQTSVDRLCAEAGVTKGAFFHHFRDKEGYIAELIQHFSDRGAQVLAQAHLDTQVDASARLRAYLGLMEQLYEHDPQFRAGCLFIILAHEHEDEGSPIRQLCARGLDRWLDSASQQFTEIAARCPRPPTVAPQALAEQLLFTIEGALVVGRTRAQSGGVSRALQAFEAWARLALGLPV